MLGDTVQLAYVDQSRDAIDDPDKTAWEEISGGAEVIHLGDYEMNSRVYAGAFTFKGTDQQKKVGRPVGGERNGSTWPSSCARRRKRAAARRADQRP